MQSSKYPTMHHSHLNPGLSWMLGGYSGRGVELYCPEVTDLAHPFIDLHDNLPAILYSPATQSKSVMEPGLQLHLSGGHLVWTSQSHHKTWHQQPLTSASIAAIGVKAREWT